ncbi:NF-X1-type zinc finger protein NFXL1-like isoform X2 [Rhodnius prolixus]|uniref:Uncharacterized protein n=1 Tax=Rhodnius prolixus TaxID=13249 RepID=T1IBB7_RHOPR
MWPLFVKIGIPLVFGIGLGIVLLLQSSLSESDYDSTRRGTGADSSNRDRSRRKTSKSREEENQRELLENSLSNGSAECTICADLISNKHKVWPCPHCWNIFHLNCVSKWAESNVNQSVWSCPMCRKEFHQNRLPLRYRCMCGRIAEPKVIAGVTPHCCGKSCGRKCGRLCHPGPCSRDSSL